MKKTFDEVFEDRTKYGTKIKTDEYGECGKHIIIDQGQERIAGYTDLEEGLLEEVPAIIFGDHTRVIKYVDEPFFLGADGVKVLRSKYENANYKYLYYALKNANIPNTGYNRHFKWLKEVEIEYPDMDKQAEIVDILDRVTAVIEARQQELQKLDELIKARFVEMINEEESFPIKLKDIVKGDRIITYGMVKPGNDVEGGVIIIKVKDFPNGIIRTDDFLHSDPVLEAKYARSRVKEGDLLYSIRGTVGRTAFVTKELEGANITQDTARLSVDAKRYDANYVRYALGYDSVRIEIEKQIKGVAMKGISLSELREIEIPCVDYEKQVAFGMFVKQLDKSKVVIQKALDETQVLFNSLMQKYFG